MLAQLPGLCGGRDVAINQRCAKNLHGRSTKAARCPSSVKSYGRGRKSDEEMKNQRHQHKLSLGMKKEGRSTDIKYDKSALQKMAEVEKIMRCSGGLFSKGRGSFMKT